MLSGRTTTKATGPSRSVEYSSSIVAGLLVLSDLCAIFGSGLALYAVYLDWDEEPTEMYLAAMAGAAAPIVTAFFAARLYSLEPLGRTGNHLARIASICATVFLALIALAFALKISEQFSRVWVFGWFASATVLIGIGRKGCQHVLSAWARSGRLTRNAVIVGAGERGQRLIDLLRERSGPWIRVLAFFDDRTGRTPPRVAAYPLAGNVDDLVRYAREHRCDDIIITLPWSAEQRISSITQKLAVLPACLRLCHPHALDFPGATVGSYSGIPVLNLGNKPLDGWKSVLKAVEDRGVAALLLVLASPLMLAIGALVVLDNPGPVFFRQRRYGFNNQLINVLKFRTMYADRQDEAGEQLTTRDDPRVTRVGHWLRRTSLDELPQLINVLRGEMSMVGPRPHAVKANVCGVKLYEQAVVRYAARHKVKPGITGWAQINGWRGETDTEEKIIKRVEHDLYYIDNWSLLLDAKIMLRTVRVVLGARNAC